MRQSTSLFMLSLKLLDINFQQTFSKAHQPFHLHDFLISYLGMAWSLVSPASRGIGFELTRQLLLTTKIPVVATARKDVDRVKENILSNLKDVDSSRLTVLELDVTSTLSFSFSLSYSSNPSNKRTGLTTQQTKTQSSVPPKTLPPCSMPQKVTSTSPSAYPESCIQKNPPHNSITNPLPRHSQ